MPYSKSQKYSGSVTVALTLRQQWALAEAIGQRMSEEKRNVTMAEMMRDALNAYLGLDAE